MDSESRSRAFKIITLINYYFDILVFVLYLLSSLYTHFKVKFQVHESVKHKHKGSVFSSMLEVSLSTGILWLNQFYFLWSVNFILFGK